VVIILGDVLAEGERDKVLQSPPDNLKLPDEVLDKPEVDDIPATASNPLLNTPEPLELPEPPETPKINPNTITGKRARLPRGSYAKMHKSGLTANLLEMENEGACYTGPRLLKES
jgi:hypothetical protein